MLNLTLFWISAVINAVTGTERAGYELCVDPHGSGTRNINRFSRTAGFSRVPSSLQLTTDLLLQHSSFMSSPKRYQDVITICSCETWILNIDLKKQINVFGNKCHNIMGYRWNDFVSNQ